MPKDKQTFQKIFISGLLILIPMVVTVAVLVFLFNLLDNWLSPYGAQILRALGANLPDSWNRIPGFGILATFLLICLTGLFASNYLGRRLLDFLDQFLQSVPLIQNLYGGMRQLVDAFTASEGMAFKTVVMLEFPSTGVWTLGFLTTSSAEWARRVGGADLETVFIPAAPIPSQGLLIMVSRRRLTVLPLSVEAAFKMIATLGLVAGQEKILAAAQDSRSKSSSLRVRPTRPKSSARRSGKK